MIRGNFLLNIYDDNGGGDDDDDGAYFVLQASLPEFIVGVSDPGPARFILYSNLPITCQGITRINIPLFCWITFAIRSTEDIAVRIHGRYYTKHACTYRFHEEDWKPEQRVAYNSNRSLDIVAQVAFNTYLFDTSCFVAQRLNVGLRSANFRCFALDLYS